MSNGCQQCQTLHDRSQRMAQRVERTKSIQHDEVALQRLAYAALVRSCTDHYRETKHVVDFSDSMVAVLSRPFAP